MTRSMQKGFTLIELMIVVAIIAILAAAVVLPAYQDCTVRAKVTEGLIAMSSVKNILSEAVQLDSPSAVTAAAIGCCEASPRRRSGPNTWPTSRRPTTASSP